MPRGAALRPRGKPYPNTENLSYRNIRARQYYLACSDNCGDTPVRAWAETSARTSAWLVAHQRSRFSARFVAARSKVAGVEQAAEPHQQLPILISAPAPQRRQQVCVAAEPAAVLGRAGPAPRQAHSPLRLRRAPQQTLDADGKGYASNQLPALSSSRRSRAR